MFQPQLNHLKPFKTLYKTFQIFVDGPFGAPSSNIFRAEHAVLIGTGIGVTPFASILQSIMHRYWHVKRTCPKCDYQWSDELHSVFSLKKVKAVSSATSPTRPSIYTFHLLRDLVDVGDEGARRGKDTKASIYLSKWRDNRKTHCILSFKVDFFWINRDQKSFEWFVKLLSQLEIEQSEQDGVMGHFLDMHMYITSALQRTDMKAVGLQLALDLLHEKVSPN